jgi:predicted MFS family arabinose efflux permease
MSAVESAPRAANAVVLDAALGGRARSLVIAVVMPLMYCLFGVTWMAFVPVMPEVTGAFGVQRAEGALLITIISMAKSVVPILAGILAAKLGLARTLRAAGLLIFLGGLAPWLPDYAAAVAVRFAFGVGGAVWVTLMGPVVLAAVAPGQRPIANAVNGVAVNAGVILALFTTLPLAEAIGWRLAVSLGSIGSGLCLLGLFAVGQLGEAPKQVSVKESLVAYLRTLRRPPTWILALAFSGPLALYLVMNTFLGQHLEAEFGVARQASMQWLSWMNLWGIPASLGAGVLLARVWRDPRPYLVLSSMVVPTAVAGAVIVDHEAARAALFALVGFGMFLPVSPLITTVQRLPGQTPGSLGMMLGTMFAVTYVVSSAVPTAVAPMVAAGVPLGMALIGAGLLGATPLAGLLLRRA